VSSIHHLDVTKATEYFLEYFERLPRLPLIADNELTPLLGKEVYSALAELESYNRQQKLCSRCANRCCKLVDCELYTPELGTCPIQSFRPLLCRMHFCSQFSEVYPVWVKELGDIFLESLLAAEQRDRQRAAFFDTPPLKQFALEPVTAILPLLSEFKKGNLDEPSVLELIHAEIDQFLPFHLSPSMEEAR
jgi:hypothetical protein